MRFLREFLVLLRFTASAIFLLLSPVPAVFAEELSFEFIPIIPKCDHPGHRSTWCTEDDFPPYAKQDELLKAILPQSMYDKSASLKKIFLASSTFSMSSLSRHLCKEAERGSEVSVVLDPVSAKRRATQFVEEGCWKPDDVSFKPALYYLGGATREKENWAIHHDKMLLVDLPKSPNLDILFGSANFASHALSIHTDYWIRAVAPRKSNFAREHICLKDALLEAARSRLQSREKVEAPRFTFTRALESCQKASGTLPFGDALAKEGIAPIFIPANNRPRDKIIELVRAQQKGDQIMGMAHLFSDSRLGRELEHAAERGVEVRLVFEDDTLEGDGDSVKSHELYEKSFKKSKIKIRFLETNTDIGQLLHSRFLLFGDRALVAGSGQYTSAAFYRNFEAFYIIKRPHLIGEFRKMFDRIWELSYEAPPELEKSSSGISGVRKTLRGWFGLD